MRYIPSKRYSCGYCGSAIASQEGYQASHDQTAYAGLIYICHECHCPTFFDESGTQTPGAAFGTEISDIGDEKVAKMYDEARNCMKTSSYTAAVLCCRKLLMHIAVFKGAKPSQQFVDYVQFLADKNYIPPDAKDWVDHIRDKGNEANHEIDLMDKQEAELLIQFSSMLLHMIFSFPARVPKKPKALSPTT